MNIQCGDMSPNERGLNVGASVLVIGGGKMGEAILGGWIATEIGPAAMLQGDAVVVVEPSSERRDYLGVRYGVSVGANLSEALSYFVSGSTVEFVLLAVKPQTMGEVLGELRAEVQAFPEFFSPTLFLSIAAGLSTARLESKLPEGTRLVRVMPNLPLLVGEGATTVCGGTWATDDDVALACDLFASLGQAFVVDEALMDCTCALNGSGPAYVAAFLEALEEEAVTQGLDASLARALVLQTVKGTAALFEATGQSPSQLREAVSSPGGTTLAALAAMEAKGFSASLKAGVQAAIARSRELASC